MAQLEPTNDDVQGPVVVGTVIPTVDAAATDIPTPPPTGTPAPPPSSETDTAVAGFITSLPFMFVFAVLVGLVIYLVRDRREITALLARAIPSDMANSIVDTAIKGVFSALGTVNRMVPGDLDDKIVDGIAKDAGLKRVPNADGTGFTWQPIQEFIYSPATATAPSLPNKPYANMERVTLPDGSYAYRAGSHAGQSRKINEDGSYTLDSAAPSA